MRVHDRPRFAGRNRYYCYLYFHVHFGAAYSCAVYTQLWRMSSTKLTMTWCGKPNAVSSAVDYAKFRSRSHDAVVRVYDDAGNVIETHEWAGKFKER